MNKPVYPNSDAFASDHANGLTKREYFTAIALGGLLAYGNRIGVAREAIAIAENVIKELNETSEEQNEKV